MRKSDIDRLKIKRDRSVKEAMKQMDRTGFKILFVVDGDDILEGTMTDGDFRKWILSGKSLDDSISEVFNPNPVKFETGYNLDDVRDLLVDKRLEAIPIVSLDGAITDVLFWEDFFGEESRNLESSLDVPVIIMAGGEGKRLDPFTKILPKPLIPIGDKPMIEVIMDRFLRQGVRKFFLTLNFKGDMIKLYFDGVSKNYEINYVWEKEFLGTAGSLKVLSKVVGENFIVSNCDIIVEASYEDMVNFHKKNENVLTVAGAIYHHRLPYGVIHFGQAGKMSSIQEKPELDFVINTGLYVISNDAIKSIPEGRCFDMTELIHALLGEGKKVGVYPVSQSSYIDVGQWGEYKAYIEKLRI